MITRALVFALVLGTIAPILGAQDLPDKPQPRTVDNVFLAEAAAMGAAWTADTVSTHQIFSESPHYHELGYFFPGSRSTAKVMGSWAIVDVGAVVAAYEWKKHVHNRYLHPLWHAFMLHRIEAHTVDGAIHNWTYPDPRS
jgi:hypothetical protein